MYYTKKMPVGHILTLFTLLLAGSSALFAAINFSLGVMMLCGILATVIALAVWIIKGAQPGNRLAYTSLACILLMPFALKIAGLRLFGYWQILLVLGGVMGLPVFFRFLKGERWFSVSIGFLIASLIWTACCTLISGRFVALAFLYQLVSSLKPLLLISFCFYAWDKVVAHRSLWWLMDYFYIPTLAFILFEWAFTGAYFKVFGAYSSISRDTIGLFPSRAVGTFEHPGFLASFAACFAMLAAARAICIPSDRRKYATLTSIYLICLLFSVQRQETFGALLAIFAMLFLAPNIKWSGWHMFSVILGLISFPVIFILFGEDIYRESASWGVGTVGEISHPRAQQYEAAFSLANSNFPFGTGLGTFGGAGAEKFNLSLYYELGFSKFWWFGKEDFLLDTYWPNSIAEGGWIGFGLLLSHYVILGLAAIIKARKETTELAAVYWIFSGLTVWFLIVNAFSSPAFQDPRLYFWATTAMALGYYTSIRPKHYEKNIPL